MVSSKNVIAMGKIEQRILLIRGEKVIVDTDLAEFYGVPIKRLNEQVKRNKERFPGDFMFQLAPREREVLKLIGEGYRNREVADYLCLGVKTVEKHRANIMKELDLHNVSDLRVCAIEKGWVTR